MRFIAILVTVLLLSGQLLSQDNKPKKPKDVFVSNELGFSISKPSKNKQKWDIKEEDIGNATVILKHKTSDLTIGVYAEKPEPMKDGQIQIVTLDSLKEGIKRGIADDTSLKEHKVENEEKIKFYTGDNCYKLEFKLISKTEEKSNMVCYAFIGGPAGYIYRIYIWYTGDSYKKYKKEIEQILSSMKLSRPTSK